MDFAQWLDSYEAMELEVAQQLPVQENETEEFRVHSDLEEKIPPEDDWEEDFFDMEGHVVP